MQHFRRTTLPILALSIAATAALSVPVAAGFIGVSRCNQAGGSSAPVLHIVDGGDRFVVPVGENGLTRNTVLSERRAMAWAAASGLFPEGSVFGNYSGYICGLQVEDTEPEQEPEPTPEPEEPTDFSSLED